jgi:hypothetical protein
LYRSLLRLPLPAMKMSAQVLNDQGNSLEGFGFGSNCRIIRWQ